MACSTTCSLRALSHHERSDLIDENETITTSKKLLYPHNGGNVNDFKRDMGTAQGGINHHLWSSSEVELWQQLSLTAGRVSREEKKA